MGIAYGEGFTTVRYYSPYNNTNSQYNFSRYFITYNTTTNTNYNYSRYKIPKANTKNDTTNKDNTDTYTPPTTDTSTDDNTSTYTPPTNDNTNTQFTANAMELEVIRLVNEERKKEGLAPFTHSAELSKVARAKSQDMADNNYFNHTSPTYGDPFTMMKSFGIKYRTAGENIAKGYFSAESVVNGWMNSSGHRANILNPSFTKIGVGYVNANGTTYWTQQFTD